MSHGTVDSAAGAAAVLREELTSAVNRQQQHLPASDAHHPTDVEAPALELSSTEMIIASLLAGATAGAAAKTTIAPLDRTKINFQISERPYSVREAINFLKRSYKNEGVLSLWRGNSATMARIVPYAAIQFTAHEQWKKILKIDVDKDKKPPPVMRLLAGSLAGVTSQSLTYPLDLARARMAVTHKEQYRTLRQVFVKIWIEEGPRTFYRGYVPTILGVIPYAGVSFFTYDSLKRKYMDYTGSSSPNAIANLLFGGVAGMLGQSSSYPLDIVRRRMQTSSLTNSQYQTILGTLQKIYSTYTLGFWADLLIQSVMAFIVCAPKSSLSDYVGQLKTEEGIRQGFFKGLSMNWIKGPVAVGISFATYDSAKDFLKQLLLIRHR